MARPKKHRGRRPKSEASASVEEFEDEDPKGPEGDDQDDDQDDDPEAPDGDEDAEEESFWRALKNAPDGVEAHIRNLPWEGKEYTVRIYEVTPNQNAPGKEKFTLRHIVRNEFVDEAWLLDHKFPRGKWRTMLFYKPGKRKEVKLHSGTYEIDPMPFTEAGSLTPPVTAAGGGTPSHAGPPAFPYPQSAAAPAGGLALNLGGGQVIGLNDLKSLKEILGVPAAASAPGFSSPYASDAYEKHLDRALKRVDELQERLEKKVYGESKMTVAKEDNKNSPWMERLLEKYFPKIEKHIDKLLGDSEDAKDFRGLITSDPEFKTLWADPEKKLKIAGVLVEELKEKGQALFNHLEKEFTR